MLRPPLSKLRKSEKTVGFFLALLGLMVLLSFTYIQPVFTSKAVPIISGICGISILVSFTIVTLRNPGYLVKEPEIKFQELLDTLDPLDIGPEGEIILTPRCRHGNICNKGVERFDHHGPYINNCVGYNNHSYFLFYILSLAVNLVLQLVLTLVAVVKQNHKGESLFSAISSKPMFYISATIIITITGLFVLPVLFLFIVHLTNFAKNKTTNERFSKQKINNTSLTTKMNNLGDTEPVKGSILENVRYNSFMGVQRRNGFANGLSMGDYRPPSQIELHNEIMRDD